MVTAHIQSKVPFISVVHASKFYGNFAALKNVSISLFPGEVHMLLGENGAGKSTLVSLLTGANSLDEGERFLRGNPMPNMTQADAKAAGINAVLQDFSLAPSMTIEENYNLGREPLKLGLVDRTRARADIKAVMTSLGIEFPVHAKVSSLSRPEQQLLEIIRALGGKPGVLILDEPTASLSHNETEILFGIVERLKSEDWAILYISHRMEEIRRLGDVVTTLRDGRMMGFHRLADVTNNELIAEIVGREMSSLYPEIPHTPGERLLEVENLSCGKALKNISFHVNAGEIVGIGGLVGCGKAEIGRAVFGLASHSGEIRFNGRTISRPTPVSMLEQGLIYLPQDRRGEALALERPISENMTIEALDERAISTQFGVVKRRGVAALVSQLSRRLGLANTPSEKKVVQLSGGNQQKVVLGRALSKHRKIFIFDEPTAGVDVGARSDFYQQVKRLLEDGAGVILVSSDLQELINLSHRAYILHQGSCSCELPRHELTEHMVVAHAFGDVRPAPELVQ